VEPTPSSSGRPNFDPIPLAAEGSEASGEQRGGGGRKPRLPGQVVVREHADDVIDAIAADLLFQAHACVRAFGDFHLALSGGSTPEPLYRRLMLDPLYRNLPWKRTHLWIVDERRVPFDDERSNFRMIKEILADHSDIPHDQVHPMRATDPSVDHDYEAELREHLGWREKGHDRLDFVVLGMGADGHTASLFPRSPALTVESRLVAINAGPNVTPPDRVTMTYTLLNASRCLAVLVTGEKKRDTIARIEQAAANHPASQHANASAARDELPILGIAPLAGELRWYLDRPACPA